MVNPGYFYRDGGWQFRIILVLYLQHFVRLKTKQFKVRHFCHYPLVNDVLKIGV